MHLSRDGLIRASIDELLSMPIVHLVSGVDVEGELPASACGRATTISGYTEWITQTQPAITIGWDWCLVSGSDDGTWLRRASQPRANLILVDDAGDDKPWQQNLECLATVVDVLPWADCVPRTLFR